MNTSIQPVEHPDGHRRESLVAVYAQPAEDLELQHAAAGLAMDHGWPFLGPGQSPSPEMVALVGVTPAGLELRLLHGPAAVKRCKPLVMNLERLDTHSPQGRSLKQPLVKALGIKTRKDLPITVLDATAGWGQDAWMLASLGCQVLAVERHPVMAALLRDAVRRAGRSFPKTLERLHVCQDDARHLLDRWVQFNSMKGTVAAQASPLACFGEPQVVYLDPMYPGADKRTSAARKSMAILRQLVGEDDDAPDMLPLALQVARKRVVVKRPLHAPELGLSCSPVVRVTTQILGKSHRLDVYCVTG